MIKKIVFPFLAALGLFFLIIISIAIVVFLVTLGRLPLGEKVAVVEIRGVITDSTDVNRQLREYGERDDVKAIVLRIDSPGGSVGSSQEIYREVVRLGSKKKIVTSMGSVAASGGYYIAAASHKIVSNPGTITGSIGVIMEFTNVEDLLRKVGLKGRVIKSGEFKDIGSPIRELTGKERRILQEVVDDLHSQFVESVAEGRGMEKADIQKIADGRFFTGAKANELNLVDKMGNLEDAIELAASIAGMDKKPVVIYPKREFGWPSVLLGNILQQIVDNITMSFRAMYLA